MKAQNKYHARTEGFPKVDGKYYYALAGEAVICPDCKGELFHLVKDVPADEWVTDNQLPRGAPVYCKVCGGDALRMPLCCHFATGWRCFPEAMLLIGPA